MNTISENLIILIDDDPISNILTFDTIAITFPHNKILAYTDPEEGLQNIISNIIKCKKIILFLDINMPKLSGWDIIDKLCILEISKDSIQIYMLSSSIYMKDKLKAISYKIIDGYFEKPLFEKDLKSILHKRNNLI